MITSMKIKIDDDNFYRNVFEHMIVTDSKYGGIKNVTTINRINLTFENIENLFNLKLL